MVLTGAERSLSGVTIPAASQESPAGGPAPALQPARHVALHHPGAASARVFGFSSWAILVPQALMSVASVWLVHDLVARRFGRAAGFAGGLALAATPIIFAMSRHNNPDALPVLCSTAALWFLVRALEDGRTR
ncbi:glycosyltransferase family 39 protein [Paraconexibacter antarcticus]|uniref:glycosyltransferase family 39 protein n=1 Tax=Paraconexibacter antarcticus TaxID=2949664 RepID=UPI003F5830FE